MNAKSGRRINHGDRFQWQDATPNTLLFYYEFEFAGSRRLSLAGNNVNGREEPFAANQMCLDATLLSPDSPPELIFQAAEYGVLRVIWIFAIADK